MSIGVLALLGLFVDIMIFFCQGVLLTESLLILRATASD